MENQESTLKANFDIAAASMMINGWMNEFEKRVNSDKTSCVALGAALIEVIKDHKWSWERSEEE